jgi:riboflavin-specific deaminase-like protein
VRQLLPLSRASASLGTSEVEAAYDALAELRADGRPYVAVNMVASADGAIAVEGRTAAMSSAGDRLVFHHLRSLADVILVGAQTVRAENYGPPKVNAARQAARAARGQAPLPRIAVVTGSLDLDWSSALFTDGRVRPYVIAPASADPAKLRLAEAVSEVIVAGEDRVDVAAAMARLHADGHGFVLCEGGPTLNGELALAGAIDELCLTVAPVLVGGSSRTGILGGTVLPDTIGLEVVHLLEEDGNQFFRFRRTTPVPDAPAADEVAAVAEAEPRPVAFGDIVRKLDYPMAIVTARDADERSGCLVGFGHQASIDPPRYAVWLSKRNHTFQVANRTGHLGVHFPGRDDRALAELFGGETGDEIDKFARVPWHDGPAGVPILDEVPNWFVGRIAERFDSGDHVCFLLVPTAAEAAGELDFLTFQSVGDIEAGHDA